MECVGPSGRVVLDCRSDNYDTAVIKTPLSGPEYAKFAVNTHRQHAQGNLALDVQLGLAADDQ